jgi:RNA polymerase sigma factor (sigma-70 family)
VTRPSLLLRMRDGENHHAWHQFVQIYRPVILGYCGRHGVQGADAHDVAQEVLANVSRVIHYFDYSTALGRFRGWLLTVTRHKLNDHFRRLNRYQKLCDEAAALQRIDAGSVEHPFTEMERTHQRQLFKSAAMKVRKEVTQSTWNAFEATAVLGRPATEVAAELGLTVGAVHAAKARMTVRLKEIIARAAKHEGIH